MLQNLPEAGMLGRDRVLAGRQGRKNVDTCLVGEGGRGNARGWVERRDGSPHHVRTGRVRVPGLLLVIAFVLTRVFNTHTLAVHSLLLQVVGTVLFAAGLALAVSAARADCCFSISCS